MRNPNDLQVDHFGAYPGYWTELIALHDWPPSWQPGEWGTNAVALSNIASAARDVQVRKGNTGTIVGLSDRSDALLLARGKWQG